MIASSGNYDFTTIHAELLIREAFELIGIPGSLVVAEQLEGAVRSINFLLSDLVNRNINLWTLKRIFISLATEQVNYQLPAEVIKVVQVELRTSTREALSTVALTTGIPNSYVNNTIPNQPPVSNGNANFAFDGNFTTSCNQTLPNGWIQFQFNTPQEIIFVGIQSMVDNYYTLHIEASNDGENWNPLLKTETLINSNLLNKSTFYPQGAIIWFDVYNPINYAYYRIIETNGATLNICELYFNNLIVDTMLTEISPYSYMRMPIKYNEGRPTIYSVDYNIIPRLNVWQSPQAQYNCLVVTYQSMIETLKTYTESINIPNYFYQAIVYGLAKLLAMKYVPDKLQFIIPEFEQTLERCTAKNNTTLPLNFTIRTDRYAN